jgi:hypothetical protein
MVPFEDYPGLPVWIVREDRTLELLGTVRTPDEITRVCSDPRWIRSFAANHRIDLDQVGHVTISTVFLGSGHLPFETMVATLSPDGEGGSSLCELESHKWPTMIEAIDGHEAHLVKWRRMLQRPGQRRAVESE